MRIAVTGSSGLIGAALVAKLRAEGDDVVRFVRRAPASPDEVEWMPDAGTVAPGALDGVDGVVHLAGEGVAESRWTPEQKRRILDSRRAGTGAIAAALVGATARPRVLVSASAIGFYGNTGPAIVDETAPPGSDFLAEVCQAWESATAPAEEAGVRVVHVRTGIVQARSGGALARQLLPFRLGLGGRLGTGKQWVSWITLDDEVAAIIHALRTTSLSGPLNATAPNPVTNAEYAKALGHVLHRPSLLPVPVAALGLLLGRELVDSLLTSQRVTPRRLIESGFVFAHPTIEDGLSAALRA